MDHLRVGRKPVLHQFPSDFYHETTLPFQIMFPIIGFSLLLFNFFCDIKTLRFKNDERENSRFRIVQRGLATG